MPRPPFPPHHPMGLKLPQFPDTSPSLTTWPIFGGPPLIPYYPTLLPIDPALCPPQKPKHVRPQLIELLATPLKAESEEKRRLERLLSGVDNDAVRGEGEMVGVGEMRSWGKGRGGDGRRKENWGVEKQKEVVNGSGRNGKGEERVGGNSGKEMLMGLKRIALTPEVLIAEEKRRVMEAVEGARRERQLAIRVREDESVIVDTLVPDQIETSAPSPVQEDGENAPARAVRRLAEARRRRQREAAAGGRRMGTQTL